MARTWLRNREEHGLYFVAFSIAARALCHVASGSASKAITRYLRDRPQLAVLAWHLLSKDEDYRYGAPTITQRNLRNLQRKAADTGPRISLADETKRKALERRSSKRPSATTATTSPRRRREARVPPPGTRLFRPSTRQGLHSPRMPALLVRGQPRQESSHPALDVFIRMGAVG